MESASIDPQPADGGTLYPKPEGWDWMTDDERYSALKQEPKPDHAAAKNALLQARRSVLHDIYSERKAIEEARQALICPRFSIVLDAAPRLSRSQPSYTFTVSATYDADPARSGRRVVFDADCGPLALGALHMRLYSIYRSAACDAGDRLPYHGSGPCMRRRRDPGGRFSTHVEITSLASYVELAPGESVSREMRLDLDERRGWKRHLEVGKEYWLRYDGWNGSGLGRHWRFGKLTDLKLPMRILIQDPKAIAIPLEASNAVRFEVVE